MHTFIPTAVLAALIGFTAATRADSPTTDKKPPKPKVEVVFCLDTTGSMGGLIEGAKAKIWSISNQIASGKPTPDLRIGLVAYRDKNDAYVTQVHDLTADLDAVHAKLKTFQAQGGGDTPEHVKQALLDGVHKIKWSEDKKALRIIFLVGDAPPHEDYKDDVQYRTTCQEACKKGIIINTIQCGNDSERMRTWKDIAAKAEGSYVGIQQDGGVVAVATPFDKRLAEINDELAKSTLVFGDRRKQAESKDKAEAATKLPDAAKADRAGFAGKDGKAATYDLLDALKRKEVELETLKAEELPEQLRKLDEKGRKEYLEKLDATRKRLSSEAVELDKKRQAHIAEEIKKKGGKNAFDNQVLEMLRKQAKRANIDY
jgi:Mg-chelatase subunit ChlD